MRIRKLLTTASAMALGLGLMTGGAAANDLLIEQQGNDNFGVGSQNGNNNQTLIFQDGNKNSGAGASFSTTGSGPIPTNSNRVLVYQTGNQNNGTFRTGGDALMGNTNVLGIVQSTSQNIAQIETGNESAGIPLSNSTVFIEQGGANGNYVGGSTTSVSFDAGNSTRNSTTVSSPDVSADVVGPIGPDTDFTGPGSQGVFPGSGGVGTAKVAGNANYVALEQIGGNNAFVLRVTGNSNYIGGPGTPPASLDAASGSTGFFDASAGVDDNTGLSQFAGAMALQDGFDNVGVVGQNGNGNTVNFAQIGNGYVNEVYQDGNGNNAQAIQQ